MQKVLDIRDDQLSSSDRPLPDESENGATQKKRMPDEQISVDEQTPGRDEGKRDGFSKRLATLRRYAELAQKYGVVRLPVVVNRSKEEEVVAVQSSIAGQERSFSSVDDAIRWIWFVQRIAAEVAKNFQRQEDRLDNAISEDSISKDNSSKESSIKGLS